MPSILGKRTNNNNNDNTESAEEEEKITITFVTGNKNK
jgi:hypothetical protein